jgi:hypothetical protein
MGVTDLLQKVASKEERVMKVQCREQVRGSSDCELQLGVSSWSEEDQAVKFAWPTKNNRWARGGEVPVWALPQMLEFAIRGGYLQLG